MFECVPPSEEFLRERLGGASETETGLFALANMFSQISTNLARALQVYSEREGMTQLDGQALFAIAKFGGSARPGAIAEHLKMPLSTMTGVANRLERDGLVERKPAPGDGRSAILVITDEGMERVESLFQSVMRDVSEILDSYGPNAIDQISEGFQIVLALTETLDARANAKAATP